METPPASPANRPRTIRIARQGRFTSNEGVTVSFGAAELAAMAAAYDPAADPAPLVVGHPALDDPAYGWVSGLAVEGDALVATAERVEPAFAELVREGRYAKVSARFYPPDHPANPAPGAWYLKHVGFLGAHAPGIKGLGTVQFAEGAAGGLTIDFPRHNPDHDPQHKETSPMPQIAPQSETPQSETHASFAEREQALATREQELEARERELAAREAEDRARMAASRHAANASFCEGLIAEARLAPAGKALVVGLLDHLDASATVSFGEAGDMAPADALRQLLRDAAPLVDFGERGGRPEGEASYTSFAAPAGYEVDPEQAALHARAKRIQADHPDLDWMACVLRAQAEG